MDVITGGPMNWNTLGNVTTSLSGFVTVTVAKPSGATVVCTVMRVDVTLCTTTALRPNRTASPFTNPVPLIRTVSPPWVVPNGDSGPSGWVETWSDVIARTTGPGVPPPPPPHPGIARAKNNAGQTSHSLRVLICYYLHRRLRTGRPAFVIQRHPAPAMERPEGWAVMYTKHIPYGARCGTFPGSVGHAVVQKSRQPGILLAALRL